MKSIKILVVVSFVVFILSGCETTSSRPYTTSTQNVIKFKSILADKGTTVSVDTFTQEASVKKPVCRLSGAVDVAVGTTLSAYIQDAFATELITA